jgi:hypothetical protein
VIKRAKAASVNAGAAFVLPYNKYIPSIMAKKQTSDGLSSEQYEELGGKIEEMLRKESESLKSDNELQCFLKKYPFPTESPEDLLNEDRIYCLLLNRLKNWVAREQSKQDGGSDWKSKFKKEPYGICSICRCPFKKGQDIVFHHELRDGRKPIPTHKECHDKYHHEQSRAKNNSQ